MPLADKIILAVVAQNVRPENGFGVACDNAGPENMVSGLDIPITVVNADDDVVLEIFYIKILSSGLSRTSILIWLCHILAVIRLAFQPGTLIGITSLNKKSAPTFSKVGAVIILQKDRHFCRTYLQFVQY